jgi:hypothetical protein
VNTLVVELKLAPAPDPELLYCHPADTNNSTIAEMMSP